MPIFCQKNVKSLKKAVFMPMFCQKNVHSLKNTLFPCHFFQIFNEKSLPVMPIFGKNNVNSVKTTLYYTPKKLIGHLFFSEFSQKILLSCPYFIEKRPFFKKHTVFTPIFCKKCQFAQKHSVLTSFVQNFHEKPLLYLMPIFDQQTSILSKLHYYMGQKSQ